MNPPQLTAGELCAGYGGLALAVSQVFNARTAWVAEFDQAPSRILKTRFPGVPNLGDITAVDWSKVEPVDILAGGTPCQDVSVAGRRLGMKDGTRSNLWIAMRDAIKIIRPTWVIWENVQGALSAKASSESDVEPGQGLMGDRPDGPSLRALGRVLGDLTALGYDTEWRVIRASEGGAPHQRARVFVLAHATGDRGK